MIRTLLFLLTLFLTTNFTFSQTPPNDHITNAILINQSPFVHRNVNITDANVGDGGQIGCDIGASYKSVYYKFTATSTSNVKITVEDSREGWALGDAFAIIYSAPNLNATSDSQLTNVSPCSLGGVTNFTPTIGTDYYILVHRSNGASVWTTITVDIPQYVSSSERIALFDFYNSTGGGNWTDNTNWNTSEPESSWNGVAVKNGHVSKIDLSNNNLVGAIPLAITTELPYLEEVNFQNNNLTETLPDFSSITTMTALDIQNNNYSFQDLETNYTNNSTLTTFSYQTQKLRDTEMSFDGIIGDNYNLSMTAIPGTNVQYQWYKSRMDYFSPSDELIPGETSNTLDIINLQNEDMDVYFCRATSPIIQDLNIDRYTIEIKGPVSQLQRDALIAIYNSTNGSNWNNNTNWLSTEPISTWHGVTVKGNKVTELELGDNNLTGTLPPEIGDLTGLQYLSFYYGNSINGNLPPEIGNLTELRLISIENNNFTGEIPASYANLTNIRGFWFNNNQLSGEIPSFVTSNYPNLVFFDISYNNFQGVLPDFTVLANLRYLSISNNHFYSSDFENEYNYYLDLQYSWYNSYYYSPQTTLDQPENLSLNEGDNIVLEVSESSSRYGITARAQTLQWYKNDVLIPGANTNPYIIENATPADSGSYHCIISDTNFPDFEIVRAPIVVDVTLGITSNEIEDFQLYPNPTNNILYLKSPSSNEATVTIYDLNGRLVLNQNINKAINEINLSQFQNGIYVLEYKTENTKIIKQ